jgi:ParB-like chromosome segregation protein Spo0J
MPMITIAEVKVVGRHRSDLGDLASLTKSLGELGQLQPIVVTPDLRLIAGERRLTAARSLGWTEIDAKIAYDITDAAALLRAERDENTCRKSFVPTEEHSLYEALLALEARAAEAEQSSKQTLNRASNGKHKARFGGVKGRSKQAIAEIVTGSGGRYKTLEKIGDIKRIASDETCSERVREAATIALKELDQDGNVSGAHMRVRLALKAEEARRKSDLSSWSDNEQQLFKQLDAGNTVVVSFREHHANLVRWAQAEGKLISVDRRTEWGNPFEMPHDGDREAVISNYANHYLPHKPSLLTRLSELRGKALACWCAPEPCHADILRSHVEGS